MEKPMTEEQIKHMRDRFLYWKLPANFAPDCGIHFDALAGVKMAQYITPIPRDKRRFKNLY